MREPSAEDRKSVPAPSGCLAQPFAGIHVALVAAHQDDETLGAGGQFPTLRRLSLIHVTDGAFSRKESRLHGFTTRHAYAAARSEELDAALRSVSVPIDRYALGFRDQQAPFHLAEAAVQIEKILRSIAPDLVITHPYEGGHPDHDATAFATAAAMRRWGAGTPLWEMASYHAGGGFAVRGDFLANASTDPICVPLTEQQRTAKHAMLDCFVSQRNVVDLFPVEVERFRPAPAYDFGQPPHEGRLMYETRRRAWRGAYWRHLAAAAQTALNTSASGLPGPGLLSRLYRQARAEAWSAWIAV